MRNEEVMDNKLNNHQTVCSPRVDKRKAGRGGAGGGKRSELLIFSHKTRVS